jgi:hypothetical protein
MVNAELIELCRTLIAAIQETDSFAAPQLRRLLLHIVPQLLTEIDILAGVLAALRKPEPKVPEPVEERVVAAAAEVALERKPARKPAKKATKKRKRK